MARAWDVDIGAWAQHVRAVVRRARAVGACLLLTSQASCLLVGYDGLQASSRAGSDGSVSEVVPDAEVNPPTRDGSVPAALDGSVAGVEDGADASPSDTVDSSASTDVDSGLTDPVDGSVKDAAPLSADASGTTPLPPSDAGDVGTPNTTLPGCMGTAALGLCWHLGAYGLSCDETCDTYFGGFDLRTIYYTGKPSEGAGTLANCQTALLALGISTAPTATYRPDGLGLGCHVFASGATYWLDNRQGPFDAGDSLYNVRRACACAR